METNEAPRVNRWRIGRYRKEYRNWYLGWMPALNVNFTDVEMEQLRTAAAAGEQSLRAFVHRAALDAASDHKRRVREGARIVAERSAELNRRLA